MQMLPVLGLSTVAGAGAGAAIGFFLGGVGAFPGAVAGSQFGLDIGTFILTWMGLKFLVEAIGQGLGELVTALENAVWMAWTAVDTNKMFRSHHIAQAARGLARCVGILFRLILQGIVALIVGKGGLTVSKGMVSTGRSVLGEGIPGTTNVAVADVVAQLRQSKLPKAFADWVEQNWEDLLRNPKLQGRKTETAGSATKSSNAVSPSELKATDKAQIKSSSSDSPIANRMVDKGGLKSGNSKIVDTQSAKLKPNTPEHKAARWADYQARDGKYGYERWSKQYDTNMRNNQYGLSREAQYRSSMGGESVIKKTPYTNRQVDIFREDEFYMGQLKTGKMSLTEQAKIDIQKDAYFVGKGYEVEHILEGGASKNYINALDAAKIKHHEGPKIP